METKRFLMKVSDFSDFVFWIESFDVFFNLFTNLVGKFSQIWSVWLQVQALLRGFATAMAVKHRKFQMEKVWRVPGKTTWLGRWTDEIDVIPRFRWRKLLRQIRTCRLSFKSFHKMIYAVDVDKNPTPLAGLSSVQVHSSVVMCNWCACFERPLDQVLSRLLFCCDGLKRLYRICAR